MKEEDITTVARLIASVLKDDSEPVKAEVRREVAALTERFRPYHDVHG
jgi:glycine/serine hydroxymethyltransferase